jgi:hypothetical protein
VLVNTIALFENIINIDAIALSQTIPTIGTMTLPKTIDRIGVRKKDLCEIEFQNQSSTDNIYADRCGQHNGANN